MKLNGVDEKKLLSPNHKFIIGGKVVSLKPISQDEIGEHYLDWLNNPEINAFISTAKKKQTREDIVSYINSLRSKKDCELFAVLTTRTMRHIGNISLVEYNSGNQGRVYYGIMIGDDKARQLGLGGAASVAFIEYIFRDPAIRRIEGGMYSDNHHCWKMIERLGFKREAALREYSVLPSGKICDVYRYGLLRKEWEEKRKTIPAILSDISLKEHL